MHLPLIHVSFSLTQELQSSSQSRDDRGGGCQRCLFLLFFSSYLSLLICLHDYNKFPHPQELQSPPQSRDDRDGGCQRCLFLLLFLSHHRLFLSNCRQLSNWREDAAGRRVHRRRRSLSPRIPRPDVQIHSQSGARGRYHF